MARVTRAKARLQRITDMLGFGQASDEVAAPKMLDWGLKEKKTDVQSSRAQRAARRAEKTDENWEKLGFQPRKMREEEKAIEKKQALDYAEQL